MKIAAHTNIYIYGQNHENMNGYELFPFLDKPNRINIYVLEGK